MKQNHKQWAEMVLQGFKQRLHECEKIGKIYTLFPEFWEDEEQ